MPGIGVIYNPRSSHNRREPRAGDRLQRALADHGIVRRTDSLEALHSAAEEFREHDVELLAISGGDGTIGVTISELLDVYGDRTLPKLVILRGGTANTLADSIGVARLSPDRLLDSVLHGYLARTGDLRELTRHVMRVSGSNSQRRDALRERLPPRPARFGFLCGVGVVSGYLQEYYASGPPSIRAAAKTLVRAIGSTLVHGPMIRRMAAPFRGWAELEDGTCWEQRDYLSIAAGTIDQIGLGFKPFHRAHERPNRMHVLGIYTSPFGFVTQLSRVWQGKPMAPGHSYEALVSNIRVHPLARTLDYMVDGDLYTCDGPLDISVGPSVSLMVLRAGKTDRTRSPTVFG